MATSIKIRETTKIQLDKLQAEILLKTNKKYSQQDLIDIIVGFSHKHLQQLLEITSSKTVSKKEKEKIQSLSTSWGIETTPEMIDEILYGDHN